MTAYTLFGQSGGGTITVDDNAYTFGVQFSVSQAATLTGIWWYSPSGAGALPTVIALYAVTGTALVHSETASWSGAGRVRVGPRRVQHPPGAVCQHELQGVHPPAGQRHGGQLVRRHLPLLEYRIRVRRHHERPPVGTEQ